MPPMQRLPEEAGQRRIQRSGPWPLVRRYAKLEEGEVSPFPGYEMKLYCGPYEEWRYAKVVASRAYVVVEEEWIEGKSVPVVEKWVIKGHRKYEVA